MESGGYDVGTYFRDEHPSEAERDGLERKESYSIVALIGRPQFQICNYFMSEDMLRVFGVSVSVRHLLACEPASK